LFDVTDAPSVGEFPLEAQCAGSSRLPTGPPCPGNRTKTL
jgi:hypothetical protein